MMNKSELVAFNVTPTTPKLRFLASLSDGTTIIEDVRDGEKHAWLRLQDYVTANPELNITGLRLQYDGKEYAMPGNQRGYYYGKMNRAVFPSGSNLDFVGVGYYDGDSVVVIWAQAPEYTASFSEQITVEKAGFFLHVNRNSK